MAGGLLRQCPAILASQGLEVKAVVIGQETGRVVLALAGRNDDPPPSAAMPGWGRVVP